MSNNINRSAVEQLVTWLRSGEYEQGQRHLIQVGEGKKITYCCLGVACMVARHRGVTVEILVGLSVNYPGHISGGFLVRDSSGSISASILPQKVAEYYGFDDSNPRLKVLASDSDGTDDYTSASVANDNLGMDFAAIADAFERTYLAEGTRGD